MSAIIHDLLADYSPVASFEPGSISQEDILHIIELSHLAPSSNNVQPWRFFTYRNPETIAEVAASCGHDELKHASALMAVSAKEGLFKNRYKQQPFIMIDVPIACLHVLLAAHTKGLGSRIIYSMDRRALVKELALPRGQYLVALVFLGKARSRLHRGSIQRSELLHHESF